MKTAGLVLLLSALAVVVAATAQVNSASRSELSARKLLIPVEGVSRAGIRDNFDEGRPGHKHEALDIMAPRGSRVVAVDDGRVAKLFNSGAGGITVYQMDPEERFIYYYAHLDRYARGITEGKALRRGELIGYVGTTGNAPPGAPHLHFTIFRLNADKKWWTGSPVNPYPFLVAESPEPPR